MSIETDIDTVLKTAGIRAFHHAAPQQAEPPFTVYKTVEGEPLQVLNGYAGITRTDIVFESWAKTWQEAVAARDAVVAAVRASTVLANQYQLPAGENAYDPEMNHHMEASAFSFWHP